MEGRTDMVGRTSLLTPLLALAACNAGQIRMDDFGAMAAFLCSEQARFITGAAIPVDGGASGGLQ